MKKIALFLSPVFILLLLDSCQALHRDIPKIKNTASGRRELTFREETTPENTAAITEKTAETPAPEAEIRPETAIEAVALTHVPAPEAAAPGPVQQIVVSQKPPQGDTLYAEETSEVIDESVLDEAMESERVAHSAFRFSILPVFSLIFFPLLFVGLIGTLVKLARFRRYEYVTEKGLEYERRAKRTLVLSILVPFAALFLLVLLAILFL